MTVAMYLSWKGIIPPKEWYHEPELKDRWNNTVASRLVFSKLIPPEEWQ